MPSEEFEPTISAGEWPQTYTLDRTATETGCGVYYNVKYSLKNRYIVILGTSAISSLYWLLCCAVGWTKSTFRHSVWTVYLVTSSYWWIGWRILAPFQIANSDWCFSDIVVVQKQDLLPFIVAGVRIPTTVPDGQVLHFQYPLMQVCIHFPVGRHSSVGIATRYGLGGPGIESWWRRHIPLPLGRAVGPNHPPIQRVPAIIAGVKWPKFGVDYPLSLAPSLKKK
jgi:hypothetical protein